MNIPSIIQAAKIILFKKKVPFYAYVSLTQACNLTCSYCFANSPKMMREKRLSPHLDTDKLKEVMDELWELGTRWITLAGGEPMIRKDLGELIVYAKKKGFFLQMTTNGTKKFEPFLEYIKKIDLLFISIEGPKNIHDLDRKDMQGNGSFETIFKNIETLRKNKIPFNVVYSASLNNMFEIRRFFNECQQTYGFIPNTVIAEALSTEEKDIDGKKYPTFDNLRNFWQEVKKLKLEGYPIFMSASQMDDLIEASSGENKIHQTEIYYDDKKIPKKLKNYAPCAWGTYGVFFDASGYLYPCSKLFDNKKYALNAFDVGFKKAYSHLKDDLNCKMCRGTINSAMTKAINITPQTALYTSWQAIKFKIRQIFLKKKIYDV